MKKLMKTAIIAISTGMMLCIAGCGGDSPKDIAIREAKEMAEAMGAQNVEFSVTKEKIDGDNAEVVLQAMTDGKPDGAPMTMKLKMKDGDWKPTK